MRQVKPRRWFLTLEMVEAKRIAEQSRFLEVSFYVRDQANREQEVYAPHIEWIGGAPTTSGSMGLIENLKLPEDL
jgi:hypothetical protein